MTMNVDNITLLNIQTTRSLAILIHGVLSLPDATSCDKIHSIHKHLIRIAFYIVVMYTMFRICSSMCRTFFDILGQCIYEYLLYCVSQLKLKAVENNCTTRSCTEHHFGRLIPLVKMIITLEQHT